MLPGALTSATLVLIVSSQSCCLPQGRLETYRHEPGHRRVSRVRSPRWLPGSTELSPPFVDTPASLCVHVSVKQSQGIVSEAYTAFTAGLYVPPTSPASGPGSLALLFLIRMLQSQYSIRTKNNTLITRQPGDPIDTPINEIAQGLNASQGQRCRAHQWGSLGP